MASGTGNSGFAVEVEMIFRMGDVPKKEILIRRRRQSFTCSEAFISMCLSPEALAANISFG